MAGRRKGCETGNCSSVACNWLKLFTKVSRGSDSTAKNPRRFQISTGGCSMISARRLLIASLMLVLSIAAAAQALDTSKLDTSKIDQILGRSGQKMGDVYKVGFPRTDLHVVVEGLTIKPGLALGSW